MGVASAHDPDELNPAMRNPKRQNPNPREAPSTKLQWPSPDCANGMAWPEEPSGAWVLNDAARKQADRHPFDLEERTARFGEAVIRLAKKIPRGPGNNRLIDQV